MEKLKEFDLFSSAVTVPKRTIPSSAYPQPISTLSTLTDTHQHTFPARIQTTHRLHNPLFGRGRQNSGLHL